MERHPTTMNDNDMVKDTLLFESKSMTQTQRTKLTQTERHLKLDKLISTKGLPSGVFFIVKVSLVVVFYCESLPSGGVLL